MYYISVSQISQQIMYHSILYVIVCSISQYIAYHSILYIVYYISQCLRCHSILLYITVYYISQYSCAVNCYWSCIPLFQLMLWRQAALIILLPTLLPLLVYAGCWTVHVSTLHNAAAISSKSTLGTLSSAVEVSQYCQWFYVQQ